MDPRQNKNFDNRGLLTAMAVSMVVLFAWEYFQGDQPTQLQANEKPAMESTVSGDGAQMPSAPEMVGQNAVAAAVEASAPAVARIAIESERVNGGVALTGGRIDELQLMRYSVELGGDERVTLFAPSGKDAHFFDAGWQSGQVAVPTGNTEWRLASGNVLTPDSPVVLAWDNGAGQSFKRTFSVKHDSYTIDVVDEVINATQAPVTLGHYAQIHKVKEKSESSSMYNPEESTFYNFLGPEAMVDGVKHENEYDDLKKEKTVKQQGSEGWIGIKARYFMAALIPDQQNEQIFQFKHSNIGGSNFYSVIMQPANAVTVPANGAYTYAYRLYAGPNVRSEMAKEGVELEESVDYGWYHGIALLLFAVIQFFHEYVGNYGVAIILTTVVLKAILFPLANKSYISMAKMKKLQPKLEKLKGLHGDNREAMAMAMMKLYKEEKINPMSGCWPILIQIPIFFAFYKTILISFEFRHAPFIGWIHDLSAMDPYFVLPVLMGASMFVQQRLNPAPSDPVQAMVMKWLPVIFTVMFLWFPAGLVLYWLTNNVLSIAQQWFITRKIENS